MHKVTTINLNGKAYQLEEKGYSELHAYLLAAGTTLTDDPDKDEILKDLEQAIADKCDRLLQAGKDVLTTEQVQAILAEMGPVEADKHDAAREESAENRGRGPRKLFLIPEGGIIGGVCNGIAAFIGVDVTIVRVAFILLTFLTGGFWIFLYIILLFVLPSAKTDEQLAQAYGRKVTAQEIIDGAKGRAKDLEPTLSNIGELIRRLVKIAFGIGAVVLALIIAFLTVGWLSTVWWILFGDLTLHGQMATISHWTLAAGATAVYFLAMLPLLALSKAAQRVAKGQELTAANRTLNVFSFGLWFVALAVLIIVSLSAGGRVRDYVETHKGYLDINNTHICVDGSKCDPNQNQNQICVRPDDCALPIRPYQFQ